VKCIGTSSIGWSVRGCFPEPPYVGQFGCALPYTRTQQGYRQQTARPVPRLYRHAVFESGGLTEGWTQCKPSAPPGDRISKRYQGLGRTEHPHSHICLSFRAAFWMYCVHCVHNRRLIRVLSFGMRPGPARFSAIYPIGRACAVRLAREKALCCRRSVWRSPRSYEFLAL